MTTFFGQKSVLRIFALGCVAIAGAFFFGNREQGLAVIFQGWTNVGGVNHAVLLFPKVQDTSPDNGLVGSFLNGIDGKWRYALRVDFDYITKDGLCKSAFFEDSGGPCPQTPTRLTFSIPPEAASVTLTKAETVLYRYFDLGIKFLSPQERHWAFTVPKTRISEARQ
jgi:hypothetical protein